MNLKILSQRVVIKLEDFQGEDAFAFMQGILEQVWLEAQAEKAKAVQGPTEGNVTYITFDKDKIH